MATFNPRKFSEPDRLKTITPERLVRFLAPFADYLTGRGFVLPANPSEGMDFGTLAGILMRPDEKVPREMVDALFYVHEMATDEAMDDLLDAAAERGLMLDHHPETTPADVAIQVWLAAPDLLQERHAEAFAVRQKSFTYFAGRDGGPRSFPGITRDQREVLENDLDDWFDEHKRGRGSRVFVFDYGRKVWILVRHGMPFRREGSIREGESSVEYYRPEKHDVLIYDTETDDIGVHADTKGERELYLSRIGLHVFGNAAYFPPAEKFTLDPLLVDGADSLLCGDVPGIDDVKLAEFQRAWGGGFKELETRKASDIFGALRERGRGFGAGGRLTKGVFAVSITGVKKPRLATIRPPNIAVFSRDEDSEVLDRWLSLRGFTRD
jgi:hypothetical protein